MSCIAPNSTNILLFIRHRHQLEPMQSAVSLHYNKCYCAPAYGLLQNQNQYFIQSDYNLGTYFFLDVSGEHNFQ